MLEDVVVAAHSVQAANCEVVFNRPVNDRYIHLALVAPPGARATRPGQFFQLLCPGQGEGSHFLRRPMSVYRVDRAAGPVEFLYKILGVGTAGLARLEPGAILDIIEALPNFLRRLGLTRAADLTGALRAAEAADPLWAAVG